MKDRQIDWSIQWRIRVSYILMNLLSDKLVGFGVSVIDGA
jgi:hypothetical protein